ncbi:MULTISPECIES: RING finger domain-containing protein [unclassified Endozoicomonas]|uniref:RING finger domain-containing protein n=1 Tax=unclassified Endozoicomonas TaxID=2644528 RepID=UPI003BB6DC26
MNNVTSDQCSICLGEYDDVPTHYRALMSCGHTFGRSCIVQWGERKLNCPLCRHAYFPFEVDRAGDWSIIDRVLSRRSIVAISLSTLFAYNSITFEDNARILSLAMELRSFFSFAKFLDLLIGVAFIRPNNNNPVDFPRMASELLRQEVDAILALIVEVLLGIALGNMIAALLRR